jgi:hypothetical protein
MYRNKRATILALLALGFSAAMNTPLSGSMFRTRAARATPFADSERQEAPAATGATLTYNRGSSVKVQQIIGDCDWVVKAAGGGCQQTGSQTITRANVAGNGEGYSFEQPDTGRLIFLFGDTIANNPAAQYPPAPWSPTSNYPFEDYNGRDPLAASTSTDPESGLVLDFFLNTPPGANPPKPVFVNPVFPDGTQVPMFGDDIPVAGIDFNHRSYIIVNSGSDKTLADRHAYDYSVLVIWDTNTPTTANSFQAVRYISKLQNGTGGHFVFDSLHDLVPPEAGASNLMQGIMTFGVGDYRSSDLYLSFTPAVANPPPITGTVGAPLLESGTSTMYFTGLSNNNQPMWSSNESDAMPVVQDVVGPPTIGKNSVSYCKELGLWLMTFDGGRPNQGNGNPTNGTDLTEGIYFTYAPAPWGPWAVPQLIFNATRDNGFGVFIHNPNVNPPGPAGPTGLGIDDPTRTRGEAAGPFVIERFTRVTGNTLTVYYTMATLNPYTVVEMKSQFAITLPADFSLGFNQSTITASAPGKVPVTLNVNRTGAFTGNVTVAAPAPLPAGVKLAGFPLSTTGGSLSFKIKLKGNVASGSYPLLFAGNDDTGRERDATLTLVIP